MQIVEVLQGDKLTEVEFPDDMSPEAIEEVLRQEFPPASEQMFSADTPLLSSSASPVEDQSIFRSFADVPLKIGSGLAIGAKGIAEAFGADSAVAENIEGIEGFLDSLLSAQSKADSAEISRLQQEAQDKGFLDQAIAALKGISTAPIDFTAQTIGTALPIIAGTAAATFAGAPASVVTALGVGAGSLMGTGIVKGAIFDVVEEELLKANVSPEEAEAVAQEAQSYKGGNLDQIGLGAILGAWAARSGLEPAIGRLISGNIARRGILKGAAIGATAEAFPEGLQGAQEQLARNLAQIREAGIDDVPLYRGVAGAGTLEGLAGGIGGGVFGAASSGATEEQPGVIPTDDLSEITETTGEPEPAPQISEDTLRTQTLEKLDLIAPNLRGTLKGRGLDDIGLKLSYSLENLGGMARPEEVDALYDPDVKTIFLGADRIKGFADMDAPQLQREFGGLVDHEMVHAVKRMNLWKDSEWRVLENAARKNFNSEGATYLQTAQERYSTDTAEIQSEEAIAELIRDTLAGRTKLAGQPLNLMQRLLEFFRKMGNSLTGTGYASFNQVVNDIDTGALGARPRGGRQATPVGTSIIGGSPALASRYVDSVITASKESAEDTFGLGTSQVTYLDEASGGTITMLERPDGKPASVIELLVPEAERRKGVGARLQAHALKMHPNMMGQVSSRYAAKSAYDLGRRPFDAPDATLEDVYKLIEENSSVNLISQAPLASRRVNSNIQGQQVMNLEGMTGEQVAAEELRIAEQTTRQEQAAVGVAETRRILDSTEGPLASRSKNRSKAAVKPARLIRPMDKDHIYHVTTTENAEKIAEEGLQHFKTSNWVESGSNERYGGGDLFAMESEFDAVKWASNMDWVLNQDIGSGEISIIKMKRDGRPWLTDEADFINQAGNEGKWLRRTGPVKPENILDYTKVTNEHLKEYEKGPLASRRTTEEPLASRGLLGLSEEDVIETPLRARGAIEKNASLHVGYIEDFVRKYVPKSKAERESVARAKEQGFNTKKVWYHGTPYNFSEFKPLVKGEAPTLPGYFNELGFFFTDQRAYASGVSEDSVGLENYMEEQGVDSYQAMLDGVGLEGNVIPVYSRVQNPFITNDIEKIEYWLRENNKEFKKKFPEDKDFEVREFDIAMREALQDMGYDGIINEFGADEGAWLIAFNPSDIRSVKATYDSSAIGSSNLLASRGAVSTRFPTAKRRIVNPIEELVVNQYQDYLDGPTFTKNMGVINSYDELLGSGTDIEQAQKFVEHVKNNLLFVYDSIDPQIRERSAKWYEGANKLMQKLADKHGLTLEQTAAVAANLSPQKDWYMNASLAERVVDIYQESINESFTPEMEARGVELFTTPLKGKDRTPTKIKNRQQNIERLETIKGKSLADLVAEEAPLLDQAMWIRIYDQTYNSPSYQVLSPEGEYVGAALNQDGAKSKSGWGSLNEIAKGLIALQDGSLSSISPSLGDANKVRNFYNNIYDPYAEEGFVTIDTHAVAAGLLRPLGGSAPQVSANFGTLKGVGNSSVTGHKGVYSLYEEAYRRAAEEKNILPREMQSITWEGIRGLFSADYKQVEANQEFANNIWKQYSNGSITLDKVREEILRHADQFSDPEWARPNYGNVEVERTSGYERKLPDAGVSRLGGEGVGSRGRVDATGRASTKKLKTKPEDSAALAADKSKALTENNQDLESDRAASEQLTTVKKLASRNNASDIVESTAYNRVADISSKRASRGQGNINNALPFEAPSSADDRGIVYQIQDKYIDLKNSIEAIKKNQRDRGLTPLIDTENPYLGEESMHGIIGNKFNRFQEDEIVPLAKKLVARNISRKEFEEFLVLRHSIERNENVRKINAKSKQPRADLADGGAGSLNGQRLLDSYVKNEMQSKYGMRWNDSTQSWEGGNQKASVLNDLSADFDSITRGTLQELKNSGLINQDSLNKLNSHYKYYAPLRGLSPDEDIAIEERARLTGRANNLSISGIETEKAKGRVSEATPPLGQIMMQRQSAIKRGTINEVVGQRMLNVIRENPNNSYWMVHEERADAGSGSGELFGVKEDGKQLFVEFKDARLREAMLSLDAAQSGKILGFLRGVNRYYSAIMTQYNPEFVIGNFARDVGTAMGNLVGEQSMVGGKAINTKGLKGAVIADVLPSIRQVYRGLRGKDLKGDLARDWKEYLESGAKTEWFYAKSPEESSADVDKLIEMAKGTFKGNMRSGKDAIAGFVSDTNSAVENGVRFATFKKARDLFIKNGVPRDLALAQAATLAKNLTVNFNRKGNSGELLNGLYLFFNASVQGTANFVRGLSSPAKQRMLGAMVSFGALVTLINEEGSEEDDKGDSYYSQIDPWRKERNLIFMKTLNPFYTGPPNAAYSIPLPYGYNVLHLLGVNAVEVGMGLESPQVAAGEMVSAALGSFAPVGFGTSKNPATFVLKGATPQIGKPLMEILLNEDFFGSPIYTENFSFGDQVPLSYLSQRSTPEAFKQTTKFLNELTGGDESMGGKYVDLSWISPDALDYLVGTQVGGVGSFVERSAKSIGALADYAKGEYEEDDISVNDIPFIRRGMFEITGRKSQSDYYDRRDDILAYDRQAGLLRGSERGDYIRKNRPYLLMNRTMESTDKRLRNINKQLRAVGDMILSSSSIEQTIKLEERQKSLEDMKQSAYDRFNKRFNEKVGRTK